MQTALKFLITCLIAVVFFLLIVAMVAWPTSTLWNYLFSHDDSILGITLPPLDMWHAWCLVALCSFLFRSYASPSK